MTVTTPIRSPGAPAAASDPAPEERSAPGAWAAELRALVGSGDRIALVSLPFALAGLAMQVWKPDRLAVAASTPVRIAATALLTTGVLAWAWSVVLILTRVPRGELITEGPYAVVKHPLYTSVALLVLPAAGVLRGSWLGALLGLAVYAGSRRYAPAEEEQLAATFGSRWESYRRRVMLPWV